MYDIFDAFSRAAVFNKMDAKFGYHQIDLDKDTKEKTAGGCKLVIFEYSKMLFGLANALATF